MKKVRFIRFVFRAFSSLQAQVLPCLNRLSLPLGRQASFGSSALAILPFLLTSECLVPRHPKPGRCSTAKQIYFNFIHSLIQKRVTVYIMIVVS